MITSTPDGEEGDNNRWRKNVTVHGDNIFKDCHPFVPKDMSEQVVSQWHKTTALHAGATKLPQSLQARLHLPQLKDICKNVCAHCPVCQAPEPGQLQGSGRLTVLPHCCPSF